MKNDARGRLKAAVTQRTGRRTPTRERSPVNFRTLQKKVNGPYCLFLQMSIYLYIQGYKSISNHKRKTAPARKGVNMSLEKILDDFVLKFYETFPNTPGKRDLEITREEFLGIVGNETFGALIKWEDKKQIGVSFNVDSTNLKTGETRFVKATWVQVTFFFED